MKLSQFIWEGLSFAFGAIKASRMRAFLTMLGVATGIFAITGILTMVNSLQNSLTANFAALGNTTIFVHHWPWAEGGNEWYKYFNRPKVSYRDFEKVKQNLDRVEGVSYSVTARGQTVKSQGRNVSSIEVVGVTEDFIQIGDLELEEGRSFTDIEHHLGSSICVIGQNVAEKLFLGDRSLDQKVRIQGKQLRVIGVMKKQGPSFIGGSNDDRVLIPYKMVPRMFNRNVRSLDKVISIKASNHNDLEYIENETIGLVRAARGLKPRAENNFAINKQEMVMKQFDKVFGSLEMGGWVISIFSILIGGFSIGNIMYISVRERTNEIGIQKALGSTRSFLLYQFIVEAVLICLLGGIIGLGLVFGIGGMIEIVLSKLDLGFHVSFAMKDILIGLGLSVFIGLISGFVPALIASKMDPVIAIRFS